MPRDLETNPATGEPYNRVRAEWARTALDTFTRVGFAGRTLIDEIEDPDCGVDGDAPDTIADLICDLLHLARLSGIDPDEVVRRATGNFNDEEAQERI